MPGLVWRPGGGTSMAGELLFPPHLEEKEVWAAGRHRPQPHQVHVAILKPAVPGLFDTIKKY